MFTRQKIMGSMMICTLIGGLALHCSSETGMPGGKATIFYWVKYVKKNTKEPAGSAVGWKVTVRIFEGANLLNTSEELTVEDLNTKKPPKDMVGVRGKFDKDTLGNDLETNKTYTVKFKDSQGNEGSKDITTTAPPGSDYTGGVPPFIVEVDE